MRCILSLYDCLWKRDRIYDEYQPGFLTALKAPRCAAVVKGCFLIAILDFLFLILAQWIAADIGGICIWANFEYLLYLESLCLTCKRKANVFSTTAMLPKVSKLLSSWAEWRDECSQVCYKSRIYCRCIDKKVTSLAHLTPRPTWPFISPTHTKALNLVLCPARVCFCTGMIFITSSFKADPRKFSTIWYSFTGRENR